MNQIFSFIVHPATSRAFFYFKIIFMALSASFLFATLVLLSKSSWLKRLILEDATEFITYRPFGAKKAFKKWIKIIKKLESNKESEYKLAVIEADNLLDDVLKNIGYKGETVKEKLEQLEPAILPNIDEVRQAHQIRNDIVYDPDYQLTLDRATKVLDIYEKAFRSLELF